MIINAKELEIKYIELKIQDNIALRNYYQLAVIAITGGIISLFYNMSILNIVLFFIGLSADYIFISRAYGLSKENYFLLNKLKALKL